VNLNCVKKVESKTIEKKKVTTHNNQEKKSVQKEAKKVLTKALPVKQTKKIPIVSPKKVEHKKLVKTVEKKEVVEVNATQQTAPVAEIKPTKEKEISTTAASSQKCITTKEESAEDTYIKNNLEKIVTLIHDNLYYPRRARKRGIEGVVVVRFHLKKDGTVFDAAILSSEHNILGRAALKTIKELSGEFPKPSEAMTLTVPIHYRLD